MKLNSIGSVSMDMSKLAETFTQTLLKLHGYGEDVTGKTGRSEYRGLGPNAKKFLRKAKKANKTPLQYARDRRDKKNKDDGKGKTEE